MRARQHQRFLVQLVGTRAQPPRSSVVNDRSCLFTCSTVWAFGCLHDTGLETQLSGTLLAARTTASARGKREKHAHHHRRMTDNAYTLASHVSRTSVIQNETNVSFLLVHASSEIGLDVRRRTL